LEISTAAFGYLHTKLRDATGDRFRAGVVLYGGRQTIPLGDRLWAIPISGLWRDP
jgi:hypothetical protein